MNINTLENKGYFEEFRNDFVTLFDPAIVNRDEINLIEIPEILWFLKTGLHKHLFLPPLLKNRIDISSPITKAFMLDKLIEPFVELSNRDEKGEVYLIGRVSKIYLSTWFFLSEVRRKRPEESLGRFYTVLKKPSFVNIAFRSSTTSPAYGIEEIVFSFEGVSKGGLTIGPRWRYADNLRSLTAFFEFLLNLLNIYRENEKLILIPKSPELEKRLERGFLRFAKDSLITYDEVRFGFPVHSDLLASREEFREELLYRKGVLNLVKEPHEIINERFLLVKLIV
uniref:Uncharacterized protein n=1 Tax=Fervidobacterium pennivorans TaxID=93466 RepID=A0A832ILT1_FERPE